VLQRIARIKEAQVICMYAARDFTDLFCLKLSINDLAISDLLKSFPLEGSAKGGGKRRLMFDQELANELSIPNNAQSVPSLVWLEIATTWSGDPRVPNPDPKE
jgi:hypothetical protein